RYRHPAGAGWFGRAQHERFQAGSPSDLLPHVLGLVGREHRSEDRLDLSLVFARKGTARLGVRPGHRGQDLRGIVDGPVDAEVGATRLGHRPTEPLQRARELTDVRDLEDLRVVDHPRILPDPGSVLQCGFAQVTGTIRAPAGNEPYRAGPAPDAATVRAVPDLGQRGHLRRADTPTRDYYG